MGTEQRRDPLRALTLQIPPRGAFVGPEVLELSGLEQLRAALDGRRHPSPVFRLTGMRPSDAGLGMFTVSMPASPWWQTGTGVFGAGALAFVADAPASGAVLTGAPAGYGITTSQLALDFLRPATIRSQNIIGRGRLVHATRSQGLAEVFVEDGRGRLLAHGTSRCMIVRIDADRMAAWKPRSLDEHDLGPDPHQLPVEGLVRGQEMFDTKPGIEILRDSMRDEYRTPVNRFLGMRIAGIADGEVTVGMAASEWLASASGTIYGGALAAHADYTATCALMTVIPPATAFAPLDLKVNFVRPALPGAGELTANARIVHRGRSIAIVHCEIVNPDGKQIAIANESILILPGRPWERPVHVSEEKHMGDDQDQPRPM